MAMELNWADIIIIAVLSLSALISLFRGFVKETFSLASWAVAIYAAFLFGHTLSDRYLENLIHSPTARIVTAYAAIFFVVLIVCSIISFLISQLVHKTGLSGTDRLLGLIFGVARGVLLVSALLLVAHLTPLPEETQWKNSRIIPYFEPIELWLKSVLPKNIGQHFELVKSN